METQTDEVEVESGVKTVLGLRVTPQLKQELSAEANKLGISLSERGEDILLNRNLVSAELDKEKRKSEELKQELETYKRKHFESINTQKHELAKLQSQIAELSAVAELLKGERVQELFEGVRGKKDTIENARGQNFMLVYNSPADLLKAMIYSFKLKKT